MKPRKYRTQRAPYEIGATQRVYIKARIPSEPIVLPGALLDQGERGSNTKCAFAMGVGVMKTESMLRVNSQSSWPPQVTARTMLLPGISPQARRVGTRPFSLTAEKGRNFKQKGPPREQVAPTSQPG